MNTQYRILDRHRQPLAVGTNVRVQRCVGRYGQVDRVEGTIEQFSEWHGAVLRLLKPARRQMRDHVVEAKPGEQLYVCLPGAPNGEELVCFNRFDDFEHGHETWIEIID